MKVHLLKDETVRKYAIRHATARTSFNEWLRKIRKADWETINDIKRTFNSADVLGKGSDRVVFNVGGNNHRMICEYNFGETRIHLYVNWIGTHSDYTDLCRNNAQYTVDNF